MMMKQPVNVNLLCTLVTMTTTSQFQMTTQMVTALAVTQKMEPWYHLTKQQMNI
jgi:hypothetical protein